MATDTETHKKCVIFKLPCFSHMLDMAKVLRYLFVSG